MNDPNFVLEGILKDKDSYQDFEGPLSLILMLLSKNKIAIEDIRISDILDQYLAYLDTMQKLDLEIASEFVRMAAHLLYIKTRTLLSAPDEEVSELEILKESLLKLQSRDLFSAVKEVLPELEESSKKGMLRFTKNPEPLRKSDKEYEYRHSSHELLSAIAVIFTKGPQEQDTSVLRASMPSKIIYSVKDKSRYILDRIKNGAGSLRDLYSSCTSKSELVATFICILELCSMGTVSFRREEDDYIVFMSDTNVNVEEILEKIEE